jgi:hypothetical protein
MAMENLTIKVLLRFPQWFPVYIKTIALTVRAMRKCGMEFNEQQIAAVSDHVERLAKRVARAVVV